MLRFLAHDWRANEKAGAVTYYSVKVKLEVRHNMLIAAQTEEEALGVALSENIPAESLNDFDREVVRTVQMKERVDVS